MSKYDEVRDIIKVGDTIVWDFFERKRKVIEIIERPEPGHNSYIVRDNYGRHNLCYSQIVAVLRDKKLIWYDKDYRSPFNGWTHLGKVIEDD